MLLYSLGRIVPNYDIITRQRINGEDRGTEGVLPERKLYVLNMGDTLRRSYNPSLLNIVYRKHALIPNMSFLCLCGKMMVTLFYLTAHLISLVTRVDDIDYDIHRCQLWTLS